VPEPVKRDSAIKGGRGQARTRLARRAVVDAARTLFLERGYVATTVEAISEHSDVPTATVYRLFSSKLGILKALLDISIAGDDQPLAVQERPDVASLFTEPDPHKLLAGLAGVTTAINQRTNDVYLVLMSAAGSDPAAAELLSEIRQRRDQGQGQIARSLSRAHALKPGLRERDAADLIHALMSAEVYRLLVGDRGWTPERYKQWLATALTQQLT
jgi:TetR/AcrR family transcriptional regulator, regulator of autoinduction and epiphytic fitness